MTHIRTEHAVDDAGLAKLREPIDDLVLEVAADTDRFELAGGPFHRYTRTLSVSTNGTGEHTVAEVFDYHLAIPVWRPLFELPVRYRFKRRSDRLMWWAPPDRFDVRAATVVSYLAVLSILSGYLGSLLSQTLSFAGAEFGISSSRQSFLAGLVRLGTPLAFAVAWIADRRGRRQLMLGSAIAGCVLAAATALAPTMSAYVSIQALARGLATALALLIGVVAVEESPSGSRAFVVSVLSLCGGLGAGMVVWATPLAGLGDTGWRWIFALALFGLIPILLTARNIPETARFITAQKSRTPLAPSSQMTRRLILLGTTAFLFTLFAAPASTLNTDYLKSVHDFSASRVALFKLVTSTPIGIGVLVAGWIADRKGRKAIGAFGVAAGAIFTAIEYNTSGASLWVFGIIGTILGGAVVPTLGVYGPELFGTMRRGRTNGIISMIGVGGSVTGLFIGSWLLDRSGYGQTFTVLLIGPLIVAGLVLFLFPETANRTLEDINPEDAPLAP